MEFKKHTKEEALLKIKELVERFKLNEKSYKNIAYDESNTRTDFIDKFFEALNWDVRNDEGLAERFRAVVREDKIKIDGQMKAPDYSFRIGETRMFFVEAKKPAVNIKNDIDPAFQVRRYAYTANLAISILTDFEEFAIYDTSVKPKPTDKASTARVRFITYDQYTDHETFDFLWDTFSYDAVLKGNLDRFCVSGKNKRGTSEIDKELLATIEQWRVVLARNIALRNSDLSLRNLNMAVQKIIDRIVFLRIAEDKDMEEMETLLKACRTENAYRALSKVFEYANAKYNSGLFAGESWLYNLVIDDKVLKSIIEELYYPKCPYAWEVLPIEILGNIYEKFLGSEITFRNVKSGHTVTVEEKPEVKKAGGVYYTPRYIVEYIVKHTVARKLEGKTPAQVKTLTICDPACGSGSFLVGAYKYLLDWYLSEYMKEEVLLKAKNSGKVIDTTNGLSLSLDEKQRILTTHIYGVDIDAQAVEVTKLSLYLQMLDGEGRQIKDRSESLFRDSDLHVLPNLGENIKCGNSLIGSDFYMNQELSLFNDDAMYKINAFDWTTQFPEIFKKGGFECIIGNPPYVFARESEEKGMDDISKNYYYNKFFVAKYQINLYHLFVEQGCNLLSSKGVFSYIIPNNWLTINTNQELRTLVFKKSNVSVLNFRYKVFDGANTDTSILVFENNEKTRKASLYDVPEKFKVEFVKEIDGNSLLKQGKFIVNIDMYKNEKFEILKEKIEANSNTLFPSFANVKCGIKAYQEGKGRPKQTKAIVESRPFHSKEKSGIDFFKYLEGSDVSRYSIKWAKREYIKYGPHLAEPRTNWNLFSSPRILVRQIPSTPPYCINAIYTTEILINDLNSMNVVDIQCNPLYLLAILNSRAVSFWFEHKFGKLQRGIYPQFKVNELKLFPIPSATHAQQEALAKLADQMMIAVKKRQEAVSEQDKRIADMRVEAIDNQINQKVYELYGITDPNDIAVIEGKSE